MTMILGLTGGIGCGKSTAARLFAEQGFRVLDSDRIVRDEVLTEPDVVAAIGARWPEAVAPVAPVEAAATDAKLGAAQGVGVVRREVLAARVFVGEGSDGSELRWLEALVHPRLFARWRQALDEVPTARWVIEVPLLFEKNLENWFDFTVCVAASSANQLSRLTERGLTQALAEARISKQLPLAKKIELSDFVLFNDGTPDALQKQVARLCAHLDATL